MWRLQRRRQRRPVRGVQRAGRREVALEAARRGRTPRPAAARARPRTGRCSAWRPPARRSARPARPPSRAARRGRSSWRTCPPAARRRARATTATAATCRRRQLAVGDVLEDQHAVAPAELDQRAAALERQRPPGRVLVLRDRVEELGRRPPARRSATASTRSPSSSIAIAFVRLRRLLASHAGLARKLEALEKKYDSQFKIVFDAIRKLMVPIEPESPKKRIGFIVAEPHVHYQSSKPSKKKM